MNAPVTGLDSPRRGASVPQFGQNRSSSSSNPRHEVHRSRPSGMRPRLLTSAVNESAVHRARLALSETWRASYEFTSDREERLAKLAVNLARLGNGVFCPSPGLIGRPLP